MDPQVMVHGQAEHGLLLLGQLERMWGARELTDVVLLAEGIPFPCHRVVLSAFSPYFQAMFTCGLRETRGGEVPLRDTPAQSLELLLGYMYRAQLPLSHDNTQGVAAAAFLLHIDGAFRLCQSYMLDSMDTSNCVGLYHWARDLGAADLADLALRYLCRHFAQVCQEEEVLELDAQSLGGLLGSDDLNVTQEESVLELVLRWVEKRRGDEQSEAQAVELLRRVRLELIDPNFLRRARRRNPVLLRDAECFGMIDAALQTSYLSVAAAPTRPTLRYGMETTDLLLCLGGTDEGGVPARRGGQADLSLCFAPQARRTYYIPSPVKGKGTITAGAVTRDNSIVVAVEEEDEHRTKRLGMYRYDRSCEGSWEELCWVGYRDMYALAALGDALYLLGGQMKVRNHYIITNSVERWSLRRGGSWLSFAPLPLPLACHCVVSLKDHLYVLGGWTPQSDRPDDEPDRLSSRVFQFDPGKDRWIECENMRYSRYRCGVATLNGEIYMLGGIGCEGEDRGQSRRCLSSVEIYNPEEDTWRSGPTLPTALLSLRTNASNIGEVEGKLYLCGYYKGAGRHEIITKEILELDPKDNVWTVVERRAAMHDSYDVCLVANLNPRDLSTPNSDP
ncbi:kelch repeat and BTB domain-containing protein 12 isoform X1 [Salmo salar]|uniref:Kelch repeat and BTB domain-containing protein 12 isoform X1 n=1 Tax=Salmo salar TaxID=8030 RepID=A0A1S3LH51_SALSA|nr:kelch repeat and BTB domain-containing protein 12-like isoform X1 [Salmo salar]|eukprot:XP_013990165.1 PREDICTED: kelch repeat and BTB domain-containing protein 12-like isoform X1 [Salmo salar]